MAAIDLLPKMILCPLRDGYNVTLGDDVITTQFENGMPRQRLNGVGRPHQVGVTFRHKAQHQEYLYNFWQFNKAKPFAMRLIIGGADLMWYECRFIGSPTTLSLGADIHEFAIGLVVKPMPFDEVVAQDFIDAYLLTGGNLTGYYNILEVMVNYHLPQKQVRPNPFDDMDSDDTINAHLLIDDGLELLKTMVNYHLPEKD